MSLLPNRFQEDPLPSLGKLVAKAISPVRDPIKEFETGDFFIVSSLPAHPKLTAAFIDELSCQQLKNKGAAQETDRPGGEVAPPARRSPVAAPPQPKARTIQDVLEDPTDAEIDVVMKLRGGCGCGHPPHRPPCSNCETPWDEEEAAAALEETSELAPKEEVVGGWVEWSGGNRPVSPETKVEVMFRQRQPNWPTVGRAGDWFGCWECSTYSSSNIVAYRVLP